MYKKINWKALKESQKTKENMETLRMMNKYGKGLAKKIRIMGVDYGHGEVRIEQQATDDKCDSPSLVVRVEAPNGLIYEKRFAAVRLRMSKEPFQSMVNELYQSMSTVTPKTLLTQNLPRYENGELGYDEMWAMIEEGLDFFNGMVTHARFGKTAYRKAA